MNRLHPKVLLSLTSGFALYAIAAHPQQEQRPQFRTEVEAVLVDVVVLDERGRPVKDLTREDFEIYEDGFPQTIQTFDVIDWTTYVAQAAPRGPEEIEKEAPTPPPTPTTATFPRRFIFVINRQGAQFDFLIRAKQALESFIVESMAEDDEAMVIDIGQSTRIIQQFSSSKEETLRSVKKIPPLRADTFYGTRMATENVYDSLASLGNGLSPIPGRKIVVFMSPELIKSRDLRTELRETVATLNLSNTTIYAVNIEGVETIARTDEDRQEAVSDPEETSIVADTSAPRSELDSIDVGGLFSLAYETGGRHFINMNVFEPAVERIGRENQRYYLLTYTPTNRALNNRYRRIEVKVNRPNVTVNARKGYFAKARESTTADADREPPESRAIIEPSAEAPTAPSTPAPPAGPIAHRPPTQVEITNYLFPAANGKVEVPIAVALPPMLVSDEAGKSASRRLGMTLTGASGAALARFSDEVDGEDYSVVRTAVLAPGLYRLDITLTDDSETIYETSTQIDVPVGYGERFGLSSIIPIPQARDPEMDKKARPTSTLRLGQDVLLNFRVFPGKKSEPSESAELVFSIYQENRELQSLRYPQMLDLTKGQDIGLQVMTSLPMSRFGPGDYRVIVWVSDPALGRRASGELFLTVVP